MPHWLDRLNEPLMVFVLCFGTVGVLLAGVAAWNPLVGAAAIGLVLTGAVYLRAR